MNNFHYMAFISYKREDEKWAKWLWTKLESYKIPSIVRKEVPRIPKHIRPVFLDKGELGAGGLTESLHRELEGSKYLIVICSPNSAKSVWVGKEIKHFLELGREKYIIPVIVDGEPHSRIPERECFNTVFLSLKMNLSE